MGSFRTPSVGLLVSVAVLFATADATAEGVGTGGFFSALMTSGNFMMMQAGAFRELGEGDDASRYTCGCKKQDCADDACSATKANTTKVLSLDEKTGKFANEELKEEKTSSSLSSLGEGTGGFFSALMTSGNFMMMQAGAFEEDLGAGLHSSNSERSGDRYTCGCTKSACKDDECTGKELDSSKSSFELGEGAGADEYMALSLKEDSGSSSVMTEEERLYEEEEKELGGGHSQLGEEGIKKGVKRLKNGVKKEVKMLAKKFKAKLLARGGFKQQALRGKDGKRIKKGFFKRPNAASTLTAPVTAVAPSKAVTPSTAAAAAEEVLRTQIKVLSADLKKAHAKQSELAVEVAKLKSSSVSTEDTIKGIFAKSGLSDLAYNSTHGEKMPQDLPGPPLYTPGAGRVDGCLTQIAVRTGSRQPSKTNGITCTSCKPGYVFVMKYHKSKAGQCVKPRNAPVTVCATMDKDAYDNSPEDKNILCTKHVIQSKTLSIRKHSMSPKAMLHFEPVLKGTGHMASLAVAQCAAWKSIACRSGKCTVKKEVRCLKVCQYQKPKALRGLNDIGDCTDVKIKAEQVMNRFLHTFQDKGFINATSSKAMWAWRKNEASECNTKPYCLEKLCQGSHGELACKESTIVL